MVAANPFDHRISEVRAAGSRRGAPLSLPAAEYRTGGDPDAAFADLPAPVLLGTTTPSRLEPVGAAGSRRIFHGGEPIFLRLTDPDQNLDPHHGRTVLVTVADRVTGDVEILRLTETGPDTGVFVGYIQSAETGSPLSYDGS